MRNILTYSKLVELSLALRRRDPTQFAKLVEDGVDHLVRGLWIRWEVGGADSCFQICRISGRGMTAGKKQGFMSIFGNKRGDEWYSYYHFTFTVGDYRKSAVEKWSPVMFPFGIKATDGYTTGTFCSPMLCFNADGSNPDSHKSLLWNNGGRGRTGNTSGPVVMEDRTGKLVPVDLVERAKLNNTRQSGAFDLRIDPDSTEDMRAWAMSAGGMNRCDRLVCQEMAIRCLKVGLEVCKEFPHVGMFLYGLDQGDTKYNLHGDLRTKIVNSGNSGNSGGEQLIPVERVYPPQLMLYWDNGLDRDGNAKWSSVTLTIPPHGDPRMCPIGRPSPVSERKTGSWKYSYQCFNAFLPGTKHPTQIPWGADQKCSAQWSFGNVPPTAWKQLEELLVYWPAHKDKVFVKTDGTQLFAGSGRQFAASPEGVHALLRGALLMDSLPLC